MQPGDNYTIRRFAPDDAPTYKLMRLEALQTEAGMFGSSVAREAAFPDELWRERLANPHAAFFGLYDGNELIGITGILVADKEKPDTALMVASYIRKAYRGMGLSAMLYAARIAWAKAHGIKRIEVAHRASNAASKGANAKFGFKYTRSEPREWMDGSKEDILYYELKTPNP